MDKQNEQIIKHIESVQSDEVVHVTFVRCPFKGGGHGRVTRSPSKPAAYAYSESLSCHIGGRVDDDDDDDDEY